MKYSILGLDSLMQDLCNGETGADSVTMTTNVYGMISMYPVSATVLSNLHALLNSYNNLTR